MMRESSPNPVTHRFSAPSGVRIYAIGDVHGHLDTLTAMQEQITADILARPVKSVHMVYMGDYIDRGPDSAGVIEYLIERKARKDGIDKTFLIGNHEVAFQSFLAAEHVSNVDRWLKYGGREALISYGVDIPKVYTPGEAEEAHREIKARLPEHHWTFIGELALMRKLGDYVFAHAGIDPQKPLSKQTRNDLTRIRKPFLDWKGELPFCVVHGHTVSATPEILPHRIGIDTGHFAGGCLTCVVLEGNEVRFLQVR